MNTDKYIFALFDKNIQVIIAKVFYFLTFLTFCIILYIYNYMIRNSKIKRDLRIFFYESVDDESLS